MILQALKEYYDRKAADPESGIAPEGWEWKEIPFIIVLDERGTLKRIEDTREGSGRLQRAKTFLVPMSVKKTSGIAANLLWDVAGYVLGIVNISGLDTDKAERATARAPLLKKAFVDRVREEIPAFVKREAILKLLENISQERLAQEVSWKAIWDTNPVMSFRFEGEHQLYCSSQEVTEALSCKSPEQDGGKGICLISGKEDRIVELHTSIKGVYGAQSTGANIVSFNLEPFRSFSKKQGFNAPVCQSAMFAYTTALNTLLGKDSTQRMQVGDASTVFWSARKTRFESDFAMFFKEPERDDPDAGAEKIRNLYSSPATGAYLDDEGDARFFVLGLAPNAARLSVRFWEIGTIKEFAGRIRRHFDDIAIVKSSKEPEYYSLWRLLVNIATQDKSENIPPNLAGDFMRAILTGTPYPETVLQAALRRIRSDTEYRVKPVRASLIKACLNRYLRTHPQDGIKEITMALDVEQPSVGYQLGRLFAVLEKIQEEANPSLNATIRERYYGSACSSPVTVFGTLMRLKNHHLAKIENRGRAVNFERLIGEIVGRFGDFPSHLDLHEQGRFAIGYFHQRQDFFTKKDH